MNLKNIIKSIMLAAVMSAGSAHAALIDLTDTSATTADDTSPVLTVNSAFLRATSTVSYNVVSLTSFDWLFDSLENINQTNWNDFAFYNIGAGNITLADSNGGDAGGTLTLASAYSGIVKFGVSNGGDSGVDSKLTISNVNVVSEPAGILLISLGLTGLAVRRKLQKRA
ncbi:MAG: hypothetical protein ACI97K_002536 [Glaciecola sp.]|jgi:hypothetical protein